MSEQAVYKNLLFILLSSEVLINLDGHSILTFSKFRLKLN